MPRHLTTPDQDAALLITYLEAMAKNGVEAVPLRLQPNIAGGAEWPDAWIRLRGTWGEADWACELKRRIERGTMGPIIHRMKRLRDQTHRAILLTEHVTPPIAEELRREGVAFADAAGNAFLQDKGLYVWVTNRPPRQDTKGERRGLHAAGMKLLFVLLRQRAHDGNLRELAGDAGIALGGVAGILQELKRRAWIRKRRDGVELVEPDAMLERWDEGYAEILRPKLFLKTCRRKPGTDLEDLTVRVGGEDWRERVLIGGELGAALLTLNLRPQTATLHLDATDAPEVMRKLDLIPDPQGDVFLVQTFGRTNRATPDRPGPVLADPLLIRGELLLRPDDRLQEVAEMVRAYQLAPRWA